jgi:hypothetical protein
MKIPARGGSRAGQGKMELSMARAPQSTTAS